LDDLNEDGSLSLSKKDGVRKNTPGIEVDKACLIMSRKQNDGVHVSVADPTQQLSEISVSLVGKSGGKTLKIILPLGGEAGETVTVKF
jgi:hypothetical protein